MTQIKQRVRKYDDKTTQAVVDTYKQGTTDLNELAFRFQISLSTCKRMLARAGLLDCADAITKADRALLKHLHTAGIFSINDLGKLNATNNSQTPV